jgi:hypothetical protein
MAGATWCGIYHLEFAKSIEMFVAIRFYLPASLGRAIHCLVIALSSPYGLPKSAGRGGFLADNG